MMVYVNDIEIHLMTGMTVRHALVYSGLIVMIKQGKKVYDEAGNEIGLDGALTEGERIYLR